MAYTSEQRFKGQDSLRIVADQLIFHSLANAYNFDGAVAYLLRHTNALESHWVISRGGRRVQLVPENVIAEANYKANRRLYRGQWRGAISIETDSDVGGNDPWTDDQLESMADLGSDILIRNPHIAPRVCPAWNEPGIGFHIMFGSPGHWTPVSKACPGPKRIKQFPALVADIKRRIAIKQGNAPAEPLVRTLEEETMANVLLADDARFGIVWAITDDLSHKVPLLVAEVEAYVKAKVQNGGKAATIALSPQTLDAIPSTIRAVDIVGDGKGSA